MKIRKRRRVKPGLHCGQTGLKGCGSGLNPLYFPKLVGEPAKTIFNNTPKLGWLRKIWSL
jgi:hypothetical protein